MSVVKSKRKESRLRVIGLAGDIRKEINALCIRNLGVRDSDNIVRSKLQIGDPLRYDPLRYVEIVCEIKENLRLLSYQAQTYVIEASKIPRTPRDAHLRRKGQNLAIAAYERIIAEFQHACDELMVDINIYAKYVDMIDEEIRLLKAWRKSDNKLFVG